MTYETQGYYQKRGTKSGREWLTHMKGMTLEEVQQCYTWFKYSTFANKGDMPTNARIVCSATGEVVTPPELQTPKVRTGHTVATIIVNEAEWKASYPRNYDAYDYTTSWVSKVHGHTVHAHSDRKPFGYEKDGIYYLSPSMFRHPPQK